MFWNAKKQKQTFQSDKGETACDQWCSCSKQRKLPNCQIAYLPYPFLFYWHVLNAHAKKVLDLSSCTYFILNLGKSYTHFSKYNNKNKYFYIIRHPIRPNAIYNPDTRLPLNQTSHKKIHKRHTHIFMQATWTYTIPHTHTAIQQWQSHSKNIKLYTAHANGGLLRKIWLLPSPLVSLSYRCLPTLVASSQIFIQSRCPWSGLFTTLPQASNPKMSLPTLLVRPDSISCLCRNSFCRAKPRPLSSSPCVSTPSRVLFPASTLPTTATLDNIKINTCFEKVILLNFITNTFHHIYTC